ncbi:unnamed protein product [Paramecium pentaurelia]|uniref:Uncharacterized protein n=1 Tax=Paramecium pentaurelia TaxID=43138 RepID=A0A8S1X6T7_9CILI|nr:unnamed protein product [Paramecium pentaurelia]
MFDNQKITPQFIEQCLQTTDNYKQTVLIKQAVQNNQEHLFETICITIKEILVLNDPNPPFAKLQAVRLSKELMDIFNMTFVYLFEKHTIESFIQYSEFGDPNDQQRGRTIFQIDSDKTIRQIGISLSRFTSECINAWALFFPETPSGEPTKFIKLQQNMINKGFKFDTRDYYKKDFVKQHEKKQINQNGQTVQIPNSQKGVILERQKIYILSCQKLLDLVADICLKNQQWVPDLFIRYENEIIAKNNDVEMLVNQLKSINQGDLAKQIIEQAAKLKQLENDLISLNRATYLEFRRKYIQDPTKDGEKSIQYVGPVKIQEIQVLHQPSFALSSQIQQKTPNEEQLLSNQFLQTQKILIQEQSNVNLQKNDTVQLQKQLEEERNNCRYLQGQNEKLEYEKMQIQQQLSMIQQEFNNYKINSEKLIKQQKDEHNVEINNYIIERQKLYSEKQIMLSQIEQLNKQQINGIEQQNNQQITQLKREIENLKQNQEIKIKNLSIQIDQYQLKINEQQTNQENLNLQLNQYKAQLKQKQIEYQILEEKQNKESLVLQQQLIDAQKKFNEIQIQHVNKVEEFKQLDSIYQALRKENQLKNKNLESQQQTDQFRQSINIDNKNQTIQKQQQFEIDHLKKNNLFSVEENELNQNIQQIKQDLDTINKPKYQILQRPIFFKHFPQNLKFQNYQVPQRRRPITSENLDLIFPYKTPQEYYQNKKQKLRKGKEINFLQDFYDLSYLNQENQVFFKQRCLGSQGILFVNCWIELGLSYQTQVSQNKAYFSYGLYIKQIQKGKKDIKVDYLEVEKFQQFWASKQTFSRQLVQDSNDLIEILVESNVFNQQVLTLMISLSGINSFQISIPIYICQQINYSEIKIEEFKTKWKKKYTSIIRTSMLKLNKQIMKDINNFMKLIPKIIIINPNKIQDFEIGQSAIKLGGLGKFQDTEFLIKFEILPNDMIYIYISYKSDLNTNQKQKLEQILRGYALIFLENNYS